MPPSPTPRHAPHLPVTPYHPVARSLHWGMAVLIVGLLGLGLYMTDLPLSPQKLQLYAWHKWVGVTVFLLWLVRLASRVAHPPPPLSPQLSAGVRRAAQAGHALLYALMAAMPLSGWLMSSAKGFQTVWFGVLPLPDLVGKDKALGEWLAQAHTVLAWLLIACIVGHVLAALKHHFIDRDGTLSRMGRTRQ